MKYPTHIINISFALVMTGSINSCSVVRAIPIVGSMASIATAPLRHDARKENFAKRYPNFKHIREGLTKQQVQLMMGAPTKITTSYGTTIPTYHYQVGSASESIEFNKVGRVTGWSNNTRQR